MRAFRSWRVVAGWSLAAALVALGLSASLGDLSGHAPRRAAVARTPVTPPAECGALVRATLTEVARRIYRQDANGRGVAAAKARLTGSRALADAVARGDARATRRALRPLLRAQIKRIEILRGHRVLAAVGRAPALAPVRGALGAPGGSYVFSIAQAAGTTKIIHAVTGALVVTSAGGRALATTLHRRPPRLPASGAVSLAGRRYAVGSFAIERFPAGPARIALLSSPRPSARCGRGRYATEAAAIGAMARRIERAERAGGRARHVARLVGSDPRFAAAVAAADPVALRAQIVRFFRDPSLHVVRIRATGARGALVGDVGGPNVLAPASAPVILHGRTVGRVTLSVQDDAGYIKLVHRFTGAAVVLRAGAATVPGSLARAPRALPASGRVRVRGKRYQVVSFAIARFPVGALRVWVLKPL